jgi:lipocalin
VKNSAIRFIIDPRKPNQFGVSSNTFAPITGQSTNLETDYENYSFDYSCSPSAELFVIHSRTRTLKPRYLNRARRVLRRFTNYRFDQLILVQQDC